MLLKERWTEIYNLLNTTFTFTYQIRAMRSEAKRAHIQHLVSRVIHIWEFQQPIQLASEIKYMDQEFFSRWWINLCDEPAMTCLTSYSSESTWDTIFSLQSIVGVFPNTMIYTFEPAILFFHLFAIQRGELFDIEMCFSDLMYKLHTAHSFHKVDISTGGALHLF